MMFIELLSFFLHLDTHLTSLIGDYGVLVYFIIFFIILFETGTVITPFLPGDSLIFLAGTFAADGTLNIIILFFVFSTAAIFGDSLNYWIGSQIGERLIRTHPRIFKREYVAATEEFYKKHGSKTIIFARFVPIVRSFAPFIAGIGRMEYSDFLKNNIIGGIAWVALFLLGGYLFGNIPVVRDNITLVIFAVVILSFIPLMYEVMKRRRR